MGVKKTRNGGKWTEARWRSFITSSLRRATARWGPINETRKEARVGRAQYLCNGCKKVVPPTIRVGGKRVKNIFVDHIQPIVDPASGFVGWDSYIERMFCERDNLQLLCKECHDEKSKRERVERKRGQSREAVNIR